MREFQCPNCGAQLGASLKSAKLIVCDYCDSTSFLEDEVVELVGEKGVMHEHPCLLQLGESFSYMERAFTPIGKARFDYGAGWWDEFWAIDRGDGVWISVDEGDIAVERNIEISQSEIPAAHALKVGESVRVGGEDFLVTEFGEATCLAVRGELPEVIKPGDTYRYAHLRQGASRLITLEYSGGEVGITEGEWLDPFEIRA